MIRLAWPNARTLTIVAVAVIVVSALTAGIWYWIGAQQAKTTAAYADALFRAQAGRSPQASPEARAAATRELEGVLQRYPSAAMAGQVAYELGSVRYADRQYGAARSAYEIAASKSAAPTLRTMSRVGIAYTWEAERNYPKAIETFQSLLSGAKPGDFLYEELLIDLGAAQELAGRREDAVQTYRRALKDVAKSRRAEDIRARLASLGASPGGAH